MVTLYDFSTGLCLKLAFFLRELENIRKAETVVVPESKGGQKSKGWKIRRGRTSVIPSVTNVDIIVTTLSNEMTMGI